MNYIIDKKVIMDNGKMAMTPRGLWMLVIGFVVMAVGYIIMTGGGSDDPAVFSEAMFDFRRLVLAPLVILAGIGLEIFAIMKIWKKKED